MMADFDPMAVAPVLARCLKIFEEDPELEELRLCGERPPVDFPSRGSRAKKLSELREAWSGSEDLQRQLQSWVFCIGQRLDRFCPSAGGVFRETSCIRWQFAIKPLTANGPVAVLRRHRFADLSLSSFSGPALGALVEAFRKGRHVLICGPAGVGKTSLLACLMAATGLLQRIVILENFEELPLTGEAWCSLLSRSSPQGTDSGLCMRELLDEALRLSPERFVFGELRTWGLDTFFEACLCGHQGTAATFHADSLAGARLRLANASSMLDPKTSELDLVIAVVHRNRQGHPQVVQIGTLCDQAKLR